MTDDSRRQLGGRLQLGATFVRAAFVYWLRVYPYVEKETRYWRRRARAIPDRELRHVALTVQSTKRGNLEGAAAFAAFTPRSNRALVIRAQVALQGIYDYTDTLAERPSSSPLHRSRELHCSLLCALDSAKPQPDYYASSQPGDDCRYLVALVDACRTALNALPSWLSALEAANRFVERILCYQSLNIPLKAGDKDMLKAWAMSQTPSFTGLRWWETAASAGSSLAVFALIALAGDPRITKGQIEAIERTYFPWVGALHSLLDNLIDMREDAIDGQRNLVMQYSSQHEAATRMRMLAQRSVEHILVMPRPTAHRVVFAGMVSFYLASQETQLPDARLVRAYILNASWPLVRATLLVFRGRQTLSRSALEPPRHSTGDSPDED